MASMVQAERKTSSIEPIKAQHHPHKAHHAPPSVWKQILFIGLAFILLGFICYYNPISEARVKHVAGIIQSSGGKADFTYQNVNRGLGLLLFMVILWCMNNSIIHYCSFGAITGCSFTCNSNGTYY